MTSLPPHLDTRASRGFISRSVLAIFTVLVAATWLYAGLWKLVEQETFGSVLAAHGLLAPGLTRLVGLLLPPLEVLLGAAVALGTASRLPRITCVALAAGSVLLVAFMAYVALVPAAVLKSAGCGCGAAGGSVLSSGLGLSLRAGLLVADGILVVIHAGLLVWAGKGADTNRPLTPTPPHAHASSP